MSLRLPKAQAVALAQTLLGETREPGKEFQAEYREALEELLRQAAGHAATAIQPFWGDVQFHLQVADAPSWTVAVAGWLSSAPNAPFSLWTEWQMSAALAAEIRGQPLPPSARPAESVRSPAPPPPPPTVPGEERKYDVFLGVELDITMRFGEQRLPLREVLQLAPGAVIELDRQISEPVDLLLDGKLIARGEVVVVDGNYGLRVLEVTQPPLP
jgi:flagellar motor switch protein FliN/FliY